jgi:teichuronic acid biosynthesis glycosyltransferase TuaC
LTGILAPPLIICAPTQMSRNPDNRTIHVLTLTPFFPHDADEVDGSFVAEPLQYLSEFNVTSSVIAAKPESESEFVSTARADTSWVRYPQLPGKAAYGSWGLLMYARLRAPVARLHRKRPIDIIHAHAALPCGHPAAMLSSRLNIPFIVTTHGLDVFSSRRERGLSRWWCERVSGFVYKRADQNVCVSRAVSRRITEVLGDAARTTVIYNGVNTELFSPPLEIDNEQAATILSVGRLVPDKCQELVIRAVAQLCGRYPAIHYEVVDDGPERPRLMALARELGVSNRVIFRGRLSRDQVAEAMKRCAVFALASRDEALGCVYLEAMATARPVIACLHQGIEEIIKDGDNGFLIEPDSLEQMTGALAELLGSASLRERIGVAARRTVVERLTLRHQAAQLNSVYRECLK